MECWANIPGFPNHQINYNGQIRFKNTGRILKGHINSSGYIEVWLSHNERRLVHRLMAETFLGPAPYENAQVNHIDCDRQNNNVLNLEWCSPRDNILWSFHKGRIDPFIGLSKARKVNMKPVRIVETGEVFSSLQECADHLGTTRGNVSRCLSGERKGQRIHGYHVEYVKEGVYE